MYLIYSFHPIGIKIIVKTQLMHFFPRIIVRVCNYSCSTNRTRHYKIFHIHLRIPVQQRKGNEIMDKPENNITMCTLHITNTTFQLIPLKSKIVNQEHKYRSKHFQIKSKLSTQIYTHQIPIPLKKSQQNWRQNYNLLVSNFIICYSV